MYLSTGEAYVGKLSTFPKMTLTNAYIFQIATDANDPEKSNFQLQPVSQTMWATEKMRLNRKNVIFYGKLSPESEIAKTIAAQANQ